MKKVTFFFISFILSVSFAYSLTIEISNPNLRPFKLHISNQKTKNIEFANTLTHYIQLMPNIVLVDDIDSADNSLSFEKRGDNINVNLLFLKTQEMITYEIKKAEDNINTAIRLADMIFEKMTHSSGIFSSNLVFSMNWNGVRQIFLSDISGKKIRKLTDNLTDSIAPKISPQRNYVVYTRYFKTGGTSLRLIDLKNLDDIPIYSSKGLNVAGSFSEEGTKIFFTSYDGKISKIFVYSINDKRLEPIYSSKARLATPVKTFIKNNISFVSDEYGSPQIFLYDIENKKVKRLTYKHNYSTSPSFAPTGTHFVYVAMVSGINKIFASSIDGSDFALLTPIEKGFDDPHWSKNERFIFALSKDVNSSSVYLIDIATLRYVKLFTLPAIISYLNIE
ncbi:MAG: hypothetical protein N2202_01880 [Proteobacteria bacterium]|nr:hypothetical protein [Pseudomonadota bacterium]